MAVSQAFFETISVISSLPTYSSDESLAQYFELCNVIDFTKIADALHLITHYGAVSAKRLDNASDEKEAEKDRKTLDGRHQIKSNTVEIGSYIPLTKVTYHEEMEWDGCHVMKQWFEYEDTDKVAYLSFDEARSHLNDMIYQSTVMNELQSNANHELEPHLTAVKLILTNYFDNVDQYDIEESLLKSEDHQKLIKLRDSIDF